MQIVVLKKRPPPISDEEQRLSSRHRCTLSQLRSGHCHLLQDYICTDCGASPQDVRYLFACTSPAASRKHIFVCCCCLPTPPCLFGGVLPYFEVTGHPVPVSSLRFKCPDCFIWNCYIYSYIVCPSKMIGLFRDNCLRYYYL